jgi:EmrB/QacA subfamily drug resistance transporter
VAVTAVAPGAVVGRRTASGPELFLLVAAAQLAASLQFIMIGVALAEIVDDLDTSLRWASWSISLFTMAQAISLPVLGQLSDRIGRRVVFVGGIATFGAASVVCAVSPHVAVLIAARAVQGAAAGSLLPSAYGIIGDAYPGPGRARALGLLSSVFPLGAIIGPNVGGLLVDHAGWRSTFLVTVPIAGMVAVWGWRRLPQQRRDAHGRIEPRGALYLAVSVGALMIAVTELGRDSGQVAPWFVVTSLVVSLAVGALFVRHERRASQPLIGIELLRRRPFAALNALNFLYGMCVFGMVSFVPLYAQEAYGFTASKTGFVLVPRALAMMVTSVVASVLIVRTGYRRPIAAGLTTIALSGLLLSVGPVLGERLGLPLPVYVAGVLGVLGIGLGIGGPSANQAGIDLLPDRVAAVTGTRGMFRALGGALGTAAIAAFAGRSASYAEGLEQSFAIVAAISLIALTLMRRIPDRPSG